MHGLPSLKDKKRQVRSLRFYLPVRHAAFTVGLMDETGADLPTEPAREAPPAGVESEPIAISERSIDAAVWDAWSERAEKAAGTAARFALGVGLAAGLFSMTVGIVLLSGPWVATTVVYGPLAAWGVSSWIRATTRSVKLKSVVADMRRSLSPSPASRFDSSVLMALLTSPRVPAGRHHRLITVERDERHVNIAVLEYDMGQVEPWNYPNGASGGG